MKENYNSISAWHEQALQDYNITDFTRMLINEIESLGKPGEILGNSLADCWIALCMIRKLSDFPQGIVERLIDKKMGFYRDDPHCSMNTALQEFKSKLSAPASRKKVLKLYISGAISGLLDMESRPMFARAEAFLNAMGIESVNPMTLPHNHDDSWVDYMLEDIEALKGCNGILLLPTHANSTGSAIERMIAERLGMTIFLYTDAKDLECRFMNLAASE